MRVLKFGGSSISSADHILQVEKIIQQKLNDDERLALVVSAHGGVTNKLVVLAESAAKCQSIYNFFQDIENHHSRIIEALFPEDDQDIRCYLETYYNELKSDISFITKEKQ